MGTRVKDISIYNYLKREQRQVALARATTSCRAVVLSGAGCVCVCVCVCVYVCVDLAIH